MCYAAVMNTFPVPKHKLIGHRGIAGLRPENTYCSFNLVAGLGLNWFEFDILLTKDQQWVVIHDEELERTTNGHGLVKDHTLAELTQIEAGLKFDPPYPGQKIPSLLGTLQLAKKLQLFSNIEVKGATANPEQHANLLCSFLTEHADLAEGNVIISSFSLPCLIAIRAIMPTIPISYLVEQFSADTIEVVKRYQFDSINCDAQKMDLQSLKASQQQHIPVFLYTVNDPGTAKFWLQQGITGLFTDRPDLLR